MGGGRTKGKTEAEMLRIVSAGAPAQLIVVVAGQARRAASAQVRVEVVQMIPTRSLRATRIISSDMSYNLNSFRGVTRGIRIMGEYFSGY